MCTYMYVYVCIYMHIRAHKARHAATCFVSVSGLKLLVYEALSYQLV
jgi:hypothetical protein